MLGDGRTLFLDNRAVVLGGTRFVGTTLWTDFDIEGTARRESVMSACADGMNDFRMIRYRQKDGPVVRFMPEHARVLHLRARAFLESVLSQPFDGATVVVTHHAPHRLSIRPRWEDDPMNGAFVSDLSQTIERHQPDLWIHGHVHHALDYDVGRTRVVCNPRGYAREAPDFNPELVIEV